jgi:hypothetical protein
MAAAFVSLQSVSFRQFNNGKHWRSRITADRSYSLTREQAMAIFKAWLLY